MLKLGAAAVAAGGVTSLARAGTKGEAAPEEPPRRRGANPSRAPKHLRRSTYEPHIGTTFRIHQPEGAPLKVKLVEVAGLTGAQDREDAFSLLFHGPARTEQFHQDEHWTIAHRALGRFPMFVEPVSGAARGQHYEAIVNRG